MDQEFLASYTRNVQQMEALLSSIEVSTINLNSALRESRAQRQRDPADALSDVSLLEIPEV